MYYLNQQQPVIQQNTKKKGSRVVANYVPTQQNVEGTFQNSSIRRKIKQRGGDDQFGTTVDIKQDATANEAYYDGENVPDINKHYRMAYNHGKSNISYKKLSGYHQLDAQNYLKKSSGLTVGHLENVDIGKGGKDVDLGNNREDFYASLKNLAAQARQGDKQAIHNVYAFVHQYSKTEKGKDGKNKNKFKDFVDSRIRVDAKKINDSNRGIGLDEAYQTSMVSEWLLRSSNLRTATGTGAHVKPTATYNDGNQDQEYDWLDLQKNVRYPTSDVPMHTGHSYDYDDAPVTNGQDKLHLARTKMQLQSSSIVTAQKRTAQSMLDMTPKKADFINANKQRGTDVFGNDLTDQEGRKKHWNDRLKPMRNYQKANLKYQKLGKGEAGLRINDDENYASDEEGDISGDEGDDLSYNFREMPKLADAYGLKIETYMQNQAGSDKLKNAQLKDDSGMGKLMQDDILLHEIMGLKDDHSQQQGGMFSGLFGQQDEQDDISPQEWQKIYENMSNMHDGSMIEPESDDEKQPQKIQSDQKLYTEQEMQHMQDTADGFLADEDEYKNNTDQNNFQMNDF